MNESEFYGIVIDDVAHFPCPNCKRVFVLGSIDGWSNFFDDDDNDD